MKNIHSWAVTQSEPVENQSNNGVQHKTKTSPHLSCTLSDYDKNTLMELTLYASNKKNKIINTSQMIRALIRLGSKYREELDL